MSKSIERRWAGRLVAAISIAAVSVVTGGTMRFGGAGATAAAATGHGQRGRVADGADRRRRVVAGGRRQHGVRRRAVQQRPAGGRRARHQPDAAGNLLAYDITTGNLITSFAPASTARCWGSRPRRTARASTSSVTSPRRTARPAAASPPTARRPAQLITSFNPVGVSSQARAVVATNDTVYVGGGFQGAGAHGRAGTWPPSGPRTARCSTGTPTPTTRCGRSPRPTTARRSSPAARSRTSAASPPTAWPRSTRPPVRSNAVERANTSATPARTPASRA